MMFWIVVVAGIGIVALGGAVAWRKAGRAKHRSQDPQNIYPLW